MICPKCNKEWENPERVDSDIIHKMSECWFCAWKDEIKKKTKEVNKDA